MYKAGYLKDINMNCTAPGKRQLKQVIPVNFPSSSSMKYKVNMPKQLDLAETIAILPNPQGQIYQY